MRYALLVSRSLLGLAWLLLLICMFLPLGGLVYRGTSYIYTGWQVAMLAARFGSVSLVLLNHWGETTDHQSAILAIALFLSELLFVASPIVLLVLHPGRLISRSIYALLNLSCVILLTLFIPPVIVSHLDLTKQIEMRLLPGMGLWLAAQVLLTLAAASNWFRPIC